MEDARQSVPWPVAWWRPRSQDAVVRASARLLGVASVAFACIVVVALIALADILRNPVDGWEGLVVGAMVLVGGSCLLLAALTSWSAHALALERADAPWAAAVLALLGVAMSAFWFDPHRAPIETYAGFIGITMALLGGASWWRLSRSRSPPV